MYCLSGSVPFLMTALGLHFAKGDPLGYVTPRLGLWLFLTVAPSAGPDKLRLLLRFTLLEALQPADVFRDRGQPFQNKTLFVSQLEHSDTVSG